MEEVHSKPTRLGEFVNTYRHDVVDGSYLVKPYNNKWEDGILALEGGKGESGFYYISNVFQMAHPP